jgi:hypothetical protein
MGKAHLASNSSGVFAVFVARGFSFFESLLLKIRAVFRYLGATMSIHNNLHVELNSLIKNLEYIASECTGFDS